MLEITPDGPPAFVLNYREILGSCLFRQLTLGVDVPEVQADVVSGGLYSSAMRRWGSHKVSAW